MFWKCFWSGELEQVSVLLWELQMFQGRKQDQEQFALSGTSKPIHLKMWPLPFWLPCCALDGPELFKRRALLGWGQLKHIPWSAVSQKICPSWPVLCDYSPRLGVILVPTGWVRCRDEYGSMAALSICCLCPSSRMKRCKHKDKPEASPSSPSSSLISAVCLFVPRDECAKQINKKLTN